MRAAAISLVLCPFLQVVSGCSGGKADGLSQTLGADSGPAVDASEVIEGRDAAIGTDARDPSDATDTAVAIAAPCEEPTGAGTMHGGSVNGTETWSAADSPHVLPYDTTVYGSLTIEACAVVRLAAGRTVTVRPDASFVAAGEADHLVRVEALDESQPWSSIRTLGGLISLTHTQLLGGGDPLNTNAAYAAALHSQNSGSEPALHVDNVEIVASLSQGVYVNGDVGFDDSSRDLRVRGSTGYPVHTYARVIGSVPSGDYTGNGTDAIAIAGAGGGIVSDQILHNRGVPYHVGSGMDGGRLDVDTQVAGSVAVLTIEPGVTVQFPAGGTLNIDARSGTAAAQGAIIAIGTAADPIVFTSDRGQASAAGDWLGLGFGSTVDTRSVLQHVRVEFAGGAGSGSQSCPFPGRTGQNDAAIRIYGPPSAQFITDTEIAASARDGIDRGFRADLQPDFLQTNTFTDVAGCKQSTPRTANGVCPATPTCP